VDIQPLDPVCSGTDFYGAIKKGIDELLPVKGRKGIVLLSDGGHQKIPYQSGKSDNFNPSRFVDAVDDSDFQKTLKLAASSAATLYFVAVDTDLNPDPLRVSGGPGTFNPGEIYNKQQIRSRIELLASASGGRVVYPAAPEDVIGLYERMAQELGSSYSLGYAPPESSNKEGVEYKIEVRVADRSLRVRQSKNSYKVLR
jgi:hypothetical protein